MKYRLSNGLRFGLLPIAKRCSQADRAMVEQLQYRAQLDPGESEAIALALEINTLQNKKLIQKEVKSNE